MTAITEDEAKKKWCPLTRVAEPQRFGSQDSMCPVAGVNRGSDAMKETVWQPNALCIGSACMAWRWHKRAEGDVAGPFGYCGAFGEPK